MKVGDLVQIVPGCWSRDVTNLSHRDRDRILLNPRFNNQIFKIVAINAEIPVVGSCTANTLVVCINSPDMIAVNDCNLYKIQDIQIKFIMNGEDVTDKISTETKRNLLT